MIRAKDPEISANAQNTLHLRAFVGARRLARLFVCAENRNGGAHGVGKSKPLGGSGLPAAAGLPDNVDPGFPINRTRDAIALGRVTRFRRKIRNVSLGPGVPETWPRSCWPFEREFIDGPLVERGHQ